MQLLVYIVLFLSHFKIRNILAVDPVDNVVQLNMAHDSAAYIFTQNPEADQAASDYIRQEWAHRTDLLEIWDQADMRVEQHSKVPLGLRKEHIMAIYAYTQESALYKEFNAATRQYGTNDTIYQQKFHFKCFHYLLSVALDKLKRKPHKTFRGVHIELEASKGDSIRLGQFTSTSLDRSVAMGFMARDSHRNTLLEIDTKLGVPISRFAVTRSEYEVLIPPFEVFEVIDELNLGVNEENSWVIIQLIAKGCQGIRVSVDTSNSSFRVKRAKEGISEHCASLDTDNFCTANKKDIESCSVTNIS
ncbi:ecto-ADP-ribosyltransferase 5-like isoform X1 [Chiloscyllium plagiosum]|uniref:ecto-ADP-ribosyltransferase 5-like isoform X1 n=1 Tax=Chiloscyllium plagiosum TaxID=36176 RepID=UPI001CB8011E|nr:ecto-ADP-ribosyltransferase 5-like isoform X1 [Chiloscyllium plagiosum]